MKSQTILKKFFYIASFICLFQVITATSYGQGLRPVIRDLKIGDTIPDLQIRQSLNGVKGTVSLSSLYKPGLLIINFWATWCVPCIKELPVLDSLAGTTPHLQVLSVAYEDSLVTSKFLTQRPGITNKLRFTTNDKILSQYFKHRGLPHNIWIDTHGIVRAITNSEEIIGENVKNFLKNPKVSFNIKKDRLDFNYYKPFHLADSTFTYRSMLTPYLSGITGGMASWGGKETGTTRFFGFDCSIVDLFYIAYKKNPQALPVDRFLTIITKDSLKFFRPEKIKILANRESFRRRIDWEKDHTFCYDLTVPKGTPVDDFYRKMADDLSLALRVDFSVVNRDMMTNVVTRVEGSKFDLNNFKSKGGLKNAEFFKMQIKLQNSTIKELVSDVLATYKETDDPYIDETGVDYPLDLTIDIPLPADINTIKSRLLEYGLKVEKKVRPYPIMVLKDRD